MNWNEMKKKAIENGFVFVKHGSRHDIYENKANGKMILIERHWTPGSKIWPNEKAKKGNRVLIPVPFYI